MSLPASGSDDSPRLEPVHYVNVAASSLALATRDRLRTLGIESTSTAIAFRAVISPIWPDGLVPVFAVQSRGRPELRRLPLRGQENFTDPLFFALPPEDEPQATRLAGRWLCKAGSAQGTRHHVAWELAVDGERVAGRFDQLTDYRFAYITGGTFQSNRLEMSVEYIQDRYTLIGELKDGKLSGVWRRADEVDHGTWEATRLAQPQAVPSGIGIVPLYEWRRAGAPAPRYSTYAISEPGWERAPRPLCRVWVP